MEPSLSVLDPQVNIRARNFCRNLFIGTDYLNQLDYHDHRLKGEWMNEVGLVLPEAAFCSFSVCKIRPKVGKLPAVATF